MVKLFFIFLSLSIVLISCDPPDRTDEEVQQLYEYFDELAYLEKFNSEDIIYENTESHLLILNNEIMIGNSFNRDISHKLEDEKIKNDTVFSETVNDTLFVHSSTFVSGYSISEISFLKFEGTTAILQAQTLQKGHIEFSHGDTILPNNGCDCKGIDVRTYEIPLSNLENTDHLYFKGQEIKFK